MRFLELNKPNIKTKGKYLKNGIFSIKMKERKGREKGKREERKREKELKKT